MGVSDINQVILVGRLTRDMELKYTNTGFAIGKISIAVNRRCKKGDEWTDEVNFFNITLMGKIAESLNKFLVKGKQIGVEGELHQSRWESDGQARSSVEIYAGKIQLIGGNRQESQTENTHPEKNKEPMQDDFGDDIPFN